VHLSARDGAVVERLAAELRGTGAAATARVADALDEADIERALDAAQAETGQLDFVFNGIGLRCAEGRYARPVAEIDLADFLRPLQVIAGSQYLTARAAGQRMATRGSGSIVLLSASLSGLIMPYMANITAACGAIEAMTRALAAEFGPAGVRVNCVRAAGMPETRTIQETGARMMESLAAAGRTVGDRPPGFEAVALGRPVTLAETAATVAWLVSDGSSGISAQVCNCCGGQLV
jgi:3-oxoacyl-[acyl-carrier protein] reductase